MRTLFLGDSFMSHKAWQHIGTIQTNHSISGETTEGLIQRLHRLLSEKPDRVMLMIGINDLILGTPLEQIQYNYTQLLNELLEIEELFILSVLPLADTPDTMVVNENIIALNSWLREQLWKYGFIYIDLHGELSEGTGLNPEYHDDGMQLNDSGNKVCAQLLKEVFQE